MDFSSVIRRLLNRKKRRENWPSRSLRRFEALEKREYLAADPVSIGVVYTEQIVEDQGDRFYVAWVGGELKTGSTTLDSIVINLDKNDDGFLGVGETFFDTCQGGLGSYTATSFRVVDQTDDIGYRCQVEDGGMVLAISFTNFHAGDKFVFEIDLDEFQPNSSSGTDNALVEGGKMGGSTVNGIAGSTVSAVFSSDHYVTETWTGLFVDDYDGEYSRSTALSEAFDRSTLPYDVDDGNEGIDQAGVYSDFPLSPKPITISGYVYADYDVDCNYDVGEDDPLANVHVTLVGADGSTRATVTDVDGYYEFHDEDLLPGAYQIFSESDLVSPEGWRYFDFCAKGGEYGKKISPVEIDVDEMQGGDAATWNNFAKVLVASVEGYVFEDLNDRNNKEYGESWDGIEYPAVVELYRIERDATGAETKTFVDSQVVSPDGHYEFTFDGSWNDAETFRMLPGRTYEIREVFSSPNYMDGKDYVGSLGGVTDNDVFTKVFVGYGDHGVNYNFGELPPLNSLSGYVYEDDNDNGVKESGEAGIANVLVHLSVVDDNRVAIFTDTRITDSEGYYEFESLDPNRTYVIHEVQPSAYYNGKDAGEGHDYVFATTGAGVHYNFGELRPGAISGYVYVDLNDNGVRELELGEEGIPGTVVTLQILDKWTGLYKNAGRVLTTNEAGYYVFDNLEPSRAYRVVETQPVHYKDGKDSAGTLGGIAENDVIYSIPVAPGDFGLEYDFGELQRESTPDEVVFNLDDFSLYKSFKLDATSDANVTATLYGLEKDGETYTALQAWDALGAGATATITGRNFVAENLWITESAAALLGGVEFNGGELLLDKLTLDGTDGDDDVKIGTETVVVETPIFTKNPYEKALANYRKIYGETSPIYQKIESNLDAAYQRLSKQVARKTTTWGVVELNGTTTKFIGTRDVAINTGAGHNKIQIDALHYNYAITSDGVNNSLDFSEAQGRLNLDLGADYRQCAIIGDGGSLKLDGTFVKVFGTPFNDHVVGPDDGLFFFDGNGGSDSVTLLGGGNYVSLVGPRQSVVARGNGHYGVSIQDGDYSVVNAGGVTKSGSVDFRIVGRNTTVFGGLGTLYTLVSGDNATISAGATQDAAIDVFGDHAVVTTGGGADSIGLYGDYATITTGAGDDHVSVEGAYANVRLGAGDDVCEVGDGGRVDHSSSVGFNHVWGDAGNDMIYADQTSGVNYFYAGVGDDLIVGGAGEDYIYGNAGDNILIGLGGADHIYGGSGRDVLLASATAAVANVVLTDPSSYYYPKFDALFAQTRQNWDVDADLDATVQLLGEHCVRDGEKDWVYRGSGRRNLIYASKLDADFENALERSPFNDVLILDDPDA